MKTARVVVAGLATLLVVASVGVSAPTAVAVTDSEPVGFTTGCGFVELTNNTADTVIVVYGDPRRKKPDGAFDLASSAVKHIKTSRAKFIYDVYEATSPYTFILESPIITEQNCPKVTAKTPKITGKTRVGETLTATTVGWAPVDVQLSYQWYRSGKKITGATVGTYTLTKSDKGKKITVKVTGAHDGYFSVSKTSKATSKVKAGLLVTTRPVITGDAKVGSTLTADPGTWGPVPVTLSYQWYRAGKKVRKATLSTYTLGTADLNRKMSVKVTGKLAGYNTVSKTSLATVKVIAIV